MYIYIYIYVHTHIPFHHSITPYPSFSTLTSSLFVGFFLFFFDFGTDGFDAAADAITSKGSGRGVLRKPDLQRAWQEYGMTEISTHFGSQQV